MTLLPAPAPGTFSADFGGSLVVYEPVAPQIHVLSPSASAVWEACGEGIRTEELVDELATATGTSSDEVATAVEACIQELRRLGLVVPGGPTGSPDLPPAVLDEVVQAVPANPRQAVSGSEGEVGVDGRAVGRPGSGALRFAVLDDVVEIEVSDPLLSARATDLLADLRTSRPATRRMRVEVRSDAVRCWGPGSGHRRYVDGEEWLAQLPTDLNRVAATQTSALALHAGVVASPSGRIVVLPASSGSGKSTLTAALADPAVAEQLSAGTLIKSASWEGFSFGGPPDLTVIQGHAEPAAERRELRLAQQPRAAPADRAQPLPVGRGGQPVLRVDGTARCRCAARVDRHLVGQGPACGVPAVRRSVRHLGSGELMRPTTAPPPASCPGKRPCAG
jgi:PqqD family protein of HPr-rel-A system